MRHEDRRRGRRSFLALGVTTLAAAALGTGRANEETPRPVRVGYVLPLRADERSDRAGGMERAGESAMRGAETAEELMGPGAGAPGSAITVHLASAPDAASAARSAERLVAVNEVDAVCGGFGRDEALALGRVAHAHGIPFLNLATADDDLRDPSVAPATFHVEASARTYLAAILAQLTRAGHHRVAIVRHGGERAAHRSAVLRRLAREGTGTTDGPIDIVDEIEVGTRGRGFGDATRLLGRERPEAVVLLLPWLDQLDFLATYEATGADAEVTGFPCPVAQTRGFYASARSVAPTVGAGPRVSLWEATAHEHGAGALNARFLGRWGVPMDAPAWTAYAAARLVSQAAGRVGEGPLTERLRTMGQPTGLAKGGSAHWRGRQLVVPIHLVRIVPGETALLEAARLVGTLRPERLRTNER